jgi:hypothetical protein
VPKITLLLVGMVLAACASTNTSAWRGLRIDGTNESTFKASVTSFQRGLPPNGVLRFEIALQEMWTTAVAKDPDHPEQVAKTYFAQLDGLGFEQIIRLAGPAAKQKYLALADSPSPAQPVPLPPCTSCVEGQWSPNVNPR